MMPLPRFLKYVLVLSATLVCVLANQKTCFAAIDCFSCHERTVFQKKVKHQPVDDGECSSCHSPHVARYKGLLQDKVATLCYSCHDDAEQEFSKGVVHEPVRRGECLGCHEPHSSSYAGLLTNRSSELCFTCHEGLPKAFKYNHAPFAKGQCGSCHQAHQSSQPNLLVKAAEALCSSCHSPASVRQKHPNYPEEVKNCSSCHNPHGSNRPGLIRNVLHEPYADGCKDCHAGKGEPVGVDKCFACHPDVSEQMASSHNHLVRFGDNTCTACHSPHAGDDARLLRGKERYVCGTCHSSTFERYDANKTKHAMTGACNDCHAPHGSNHPAMVKAPINTVCSGCHVQHGTFTHPIGENVFDPRTGQMMTCASCHASKGSDFAYHTRFNGTKDLCVQCHRGI